MEAALGTSVIRVLHCSFHCGAKSDDKCPERGAEYLLRWGKGDTNRLPNGCPYGAENDYYCERVYQAAWKAKYPDRKAFQTKLAKDKALLDAFKADVETYKEARIGLQGIGRAEPAMLADQAARQLQPGHATA